MAFSRGLISLFFQAEDGIRDLTVTGVQTCALPILRRAKTLIFWNRNYDVPRLKAHGLETHKDVTIVDAMWAWHWLYSDLPKALAFAAQIGRASCRERV